MSGFYGDNPHHAPDYLAYSILVTIFCCVPFGVPAIVYSAMAKSKMDAGDYAGAQRDAESARNWCIAAFVAGMSIVIIWGALAALSAW